MTLCYINLLLTLTLQTSLHKFCIPAEEGTMTHMTITPFTSSQINTCIIAIYCKKNI